MRIISGKYKGRKLDGYTINGTRPTMDRVKESLIGMIQNELPGSICLDLFSGSGSVGLEMLSNGATKCYFVDNNKEVVGTLNKNFKNIKVSDSYEIINQDFKSALNYFLVKQIKFDIIFLDPPYELNYINPSVDLIIKNDLLNENGLIICEYEKEIIEKNKFTILKERKYGSKNILILKK